MSPVDSKSGQPQAERPLGFCESKLRAIDITQVGNSFTQGYGPINAARICKDKFIRFACRIHKAFTSRSSQDSVNIMDEYELRQVMPGANFNREHQAFSAISGGIENDQSLTEEVSQEEEESEEEHSWFNASNELRFGHFVSGEEYAKEAKSYFNVSYGFEIDQYMPKRERREESEDQGNGGEEKRIDANSKQYWGSIDYIPHRKAISLVLSHVDSHGNFSPKDCDIRTTKGTFNKAFIVTLPSNTKYVLRVPRFGLRETWNSDEKTAFLTTVKAMEYIRVTTSLPLPRVLAYDHTHNNAIRHPYSIISFMSGHSVFGVWTDATNPNLEATRQNILCSLARTVAALSKLSFNSHGSLQFEEADLKNPTVGPEKQVTKHTYDPDVGVVHQTRMRQSHNSHRMYLERKYEQAFDLGASTILSVSDFVKFGELKILRMLLDCFPSDQAHLDANGLERFSVVPPDFDWQNILVYNDGNVTGLIDWDDMSTQHGLKGWASYPRFLRRDWIYPSGPPGEGEFNLLPQDLLRYRRDYANYISEAVHGKGDACFTMKSAIWQAIEMALCRSWERTAIVTKILSAVQPEISNQWEFLFEVGRVGLSPEQEEVLQSQFHTYLACSPGADTQHDA